MASLSDLTRQWRDDLAGWAIPESITSAVTESPWVLPRDVFARRADRLRQAPAGASYDRERAALDPPGSVLDVGAGAGAACLPLAGRTTALTAVDADDEMLARLAGRARAAGLQARLLPGQWPGVADQAGHADLVTCHHVLYNVPDLVPFIEALTRHARRQVVGGTHRRASADYPQPAVAALPRSPAARRAGCRRRPGHPGRDGPAGRAH